FQHRRRSPSVLRLPILRSKNKRSLISSSCQKPWRRFLRKSSAEGHASTVFSRSKSALMASPSVLALRLHSFVRKVEVHSTHAGHNSSLRCIATLSRPGQRPDEVDRRKHGQCRYSGL